MIGDNSEQYKFMISPENSSCSPNGLCSSQPKNDCPISSSEPCIGRPTPNDRPVIPPRNYQNPAEKSMPPNTAYGAYNRFPYGNQRLPFSGYSYGYNSGMPYYSGYNSGLYGGYGMNNGNYLSSESRFMRAAEESARPTFQAIESLTRAINSIAFMMESTFGSLNMSFQAILSVIDNFSQARAFLKQFFASLLTLRIFHKFLSIIVSLMKKMNIISDRSVENLLLLNSSGTTNSCMTPGVSMWPIFTFFGLMFGAPYLISKMLPREDLPESKNAWNPSTDRYVPLVAVHDFQSGNAQEISFQRGQKLKMIPPEILQPSSPYWVFVADEHNQTGFVPRNHVAPV